MSLLESMQSGSVTNLTIRPPILCSRAVSVRDTIVKMREGRLGCAIIVDDDARPLGIFTEAMLRQLLVSSVSVEDGIEGHMSTNFPWVKATDSVETVLDALETNNTRFLVVVDDHGTVVGLTGQKGLMEYIAELFPGEVMVQRVGGKGFSDQREGA